MGGHQIRYKKLLFAGHLIDPLITLDKTFINGILRLSHVMEYPIRHMLRCYAEADR